ncbi:MAG TPA: respiratory nitrate reductase subunit gamma [Rhodospirillaceae bacterium]|nr:respiratory nitrate reductase subunit gamma [Rhodospirillaceae bacterium]
MSQSWNGFFFGIYPYIAGAVFLIGSLVRFDLEPYSWRSGSSQFLRRHGMQLASNAFHIGVLLLFAGHFVGLLTPHEAYEAFGLTPSAKQVLAMSAGAIAGTLAMAGGLFLLFRRLTDDRVRAAGSFMDTAILVILVIQLALGLWSIPASAAHPDGSTMLLLAGWAQGVVTFQSGAADVIAGVEAVFKLHLILGMTIFLLFPFSRLVHIWSVPIAYVGRRYQLVRRA